MKYSNVRNLLAGKRGERIRFLNEKSFNNRGDFILYWSQRALRAHENPAMDLAVRLANQKSIGTFVYCGLSESYPYASDRHHTFMLEGLEQFRAETESRGLGFGFHLERDGHRGHHLDELILNSAALVVEEIPVFPWRRWIHQLADRVSVPVMAVDCDCVVPMRTVNSGYDRAYKYRNATESRRENRLATDWPEPEPEVRHYRPDPLEFEDLRVGDNRVETLLAHCEIDHAVGPVGHRHGGSEAGYRRWNTFRNQNLDDYHQLRNVPSLPEAVSRLSPYLHYGFVSSFRIVRESLSTNAEGSDKFVDELVTWRDLAHYFCFYNPNHRNLEVLPDWAYSTLKDHQNDRRGVLYSWEQLAEARTDDSFWNTCQEWLLRHGELHNNLRMTWAKQLLQWTETPERALNLCIDLNDRYALDGRDPNSYLGILWCFGLMDRPYDRDDEITGSLRPRSTDWHASQTQVQKIESVVHTSPYDSDPSVGIVGIGMAGASCSKVLRNHGIDVQLYEKSRGHGGRASTRYTESTRTVTFDHGAQYLTIRNTMTEKYKKSWLRDEVLSEWDVDPAVIEQKQTGRETGTRRFVPIPTMNKIVKHLTDGAEKLFQTRIETITRKDDKYRLVDEDGNQFDHDWLVLTAPPRQTDDLMGDLPESSILEDVEISMLPTWSYVCLLESEIPSEFEAAFVNDQSPIRWVARNGSKPERKNQPSWVVQAEHDWSDRNINKSENWVVEELHESFRKLLGEPSLNVDHEEAHRWRYARAENPSEIGSWQQGGVIVSGDWLNGSRMEGAFLSGQHAAGRILRKLKVESES